jgi:hypothetical protein
VKKRKKARTLFWKKDSRTGRSIPNSRKMLIETRANDRTISKLIAELSADYNPPEAIVLNRFRKNIRNF